MGVQARKAHTVKLPQAYRLGCDLITNAAYRDFVPARGYEREEFWRKVGRSVRRLLTLDGKTLGPATRLRAEKLPSQKDHHPVKGNFFMEAQAFVE
jgi:formylglycine-generating enzyme required for sulfatase activity